MAKSRKAARAKAASARVAVKASARKASVGKSAARKTNARKVAVRKSVARKPVSLKTARASRAATPSARGKVDAKRVAKAKREVAAALKPQTVAVSHYNNADFESGLRSYAQYRDLGIVEATGGMVRAHVLRFTEPCDPKVVSKLHFHDTQFQMVYVLKGWVKTRLGDHDEITMREGSAWTQPPRIRHVINDYSEDAELLEIILPADFETEEV